MLFFRNAFSLPLLILSTVTCQVDRRGLLNGLLYQHTRNFFCLLSVFPVFREREIRALKKGKGGGSSSLASRKLCLLMDVSRADLTGLSDCLCSQESC